MKTLLILAIFDENIFFYFIMGCLARNLEAIS
jgi:hypothetical protein